MPPTTLSRALIVATLTAAAITFSGCSLIGNAVNGAVTGEDDVFSLKVGSCMNDYGSETEITSVPIVECSEPHDTEIYFASSVAGDEYPGLEAVQTQADEDCRSAFEGFVGLAYDDSVLYYSTLYPSDESWGGGDREILCGISKYDENEEIVKVTGSLKGVAE